MTSGLNTDLCIVGAGPVGATLGALLAAAGVSVAIIDNAPLPPMELPDFDGRAYAIAASSRHLLDAAGIWDRLPTEPCAIRAIRVADGRPGERPSRLGLRFDAQAMDEPAFGWMVEARALRVALNARLPTMANLQVFAPATAEVQRDAEGASLVLSDGRRITTRLVVAAEGRRSPLRRGAGIAEAGLDYRQLGMVGAFAHERSHQGVALEQFLPSGPFAQLPLTGTAEHPNMSAYVWSETRQLGEAAMALSDAGFGRELARRLGGHLGAVTPVGRRWSYPLSAMHVERLTDTRLALVGDAAHGIHPISGQGLNLGFRDVAALAEAVIEAVNAGEDPGGAAVLARYQAARRGDNLVVLGATHALERLFTNDFGPVRVARRLGIAAVDRMPSAKRWFARQAMGYGGASAGLLAGRGI